MSAFREALAKMMGGSGAPSSGGPDVRAAFEAGEEAAKAAHRAITGHMSGLTHSIEKVLVMMVAIQKLHSAMHMRVMKDDPDSAPRKVWTVMDRVFKMTEEEMLDAIKRGDLFKK